MSRTNADGDIQGFVLAGGRSSRMGRDKALIRFDGQPLVERALGVLREAGISATVAGEHSSLGAFATVVEDSTLGLGPLGGICAALASTTASRAVFLPVDMPLLPASLVACLVEHAEITGMAVTAASVNGWAQTFPVVLTREVLPVLDRRLQSGERGCYSAFLAAAASLGQPMAILTVENLVQSGCVEHPDGLPASRWFLNVNAPADLWRAENLATRRHRVS